MDRHGDSPSALEHALLDAISDVNGGAMLVVDGDDLVLYASPQLLLLFDIPDFYLVPGTRLRDLLGAIYDHCLRATVSPPPSSRESWLSERVAAHWRERLEVIDYTSKKRVVRGVMRRMSSGVGICILTDVTEQKKREENWRADLERVKVTEDILDSLPQPLVVLDEQWKIAAVNKAFSTMVQQRDDLLIDLPASAVFDPSFVNTMQAAAANAHAMAGCVAIGNSDQPKTDASERPQAYLHKVGKTGRSFSVVTFATVETTPRKNMIARPHHADLSKPDMIVANRAKPNQKNRPETIVIVTGDPLFETRALQVLHSPRTDHCIVRNQAELQAFLNLAESIDISIDLAVIDNTMPSAAADIARQKARSVVVIDRQHVADTLRRRLEKSPATRANLATVPKAEDLAALPAKTLPEGLEILVVEDNEVNQIVFSQILEGMGCRYRLATNAAEALALWESEKPQVVLMDISLPDMNGMDVCRMMRRKELAGRPRCLIVGVLVPAFDHDRPRCLEAGMDDVIVKPLSPDMIEHLLRRHLVAKPATQGHGSIK